MAKIVTDEQHYHDIAMTIRQMRQQDPLATDKDKRYKPSEMPAGVYAVYQAGNNVGYDAGNAQGVQSGREAQKSHFWNCFLGGGYVDGSNLFGGAGWNDSTFYPDRDIVIADEASAQYMFGYNAVTNIKQRLEECGVYLDLSRTTSGYFTFSNAVTTELPTVDFRNATDIRSAFVNCRQLVTIDQLCMNADTTVNTGLFQQCTELANIKIVGEIGSNGITFQWSNNLTHDSLMSIINALKDYSTDTSGTTYKITLGSTNLAKLTEDEQDIARRKGWTLG